MMIKMLLMMILKLKWWCYYLKYCWLDNVDDHKVKNNAVMSMMLKMMRNEGDRYETLSVGSGRKLVLILRK